ncbi:MAG: hypothetical protein HY302_11755 [Opitutae bacterium]|nr:hypothetical protein [Opitutae bacterium]
MKLESLDWEVLDRLRETFLTDAKSAGPYWHTMTDLECYDLTYGERIGWKWDAVLRELRLRGWAPSAGGTILDWGCGSGVAGRRVVDFFGAMNFSRLLLHDHSELAMRFAEHRARKVFPGLAVETAGVRDLRGDAPLDMLVVSHVVNELDEAGRADLAALIARAATVLWVEPGTSDVSRVLVSWREKLRGDFRVVAPCTHQAACGLLAPANARHWCHHFAAPPPEIFANSDWVRFGQRAGIDLRNLPYSFLVLDRPSPRLRPASRPEVGSEQNAASSARPADARRPDNEEQNPEPGPPADLSAIARGATAEASAKEGLSRILGEPRFYKGYAKLFSCSAAGVEELMLPQRADKGFFKALSRARGPLLYRWTRAGAQITAAAPLSPAAPSRPAAAAPDSGTP